MKMRWFKKYSVAMKAPSGAAARILMQEKVLQFQDDEGNWHDIPVVNDEEGYQKAKAALSEPAPFFNRIRGNDIDNSDTSDIGGDED